MANQDYFSQHTAELLKAYGYPQTALGKYIEKIDGTEREEWNEEELRMESVTDINIYAKDTLLEAQRWLREKHYVVAYAEPIKARVAGLSFEYIPAVLEWDGTKHRMKEVYEYYEEAIDVAIQFALKNYCPMPKTRKEDEV
ncbi:MAG: hypothetical protein IJ551_09750 [Prevotella sp.]|nr:hypothetical protein [Prevotella sp.]